MLVPRGSRVADAARRPRHHRCASRLAATRLRSTSRAARSALAFASTVALSSSRFRPDMDTFFPDDPSKDWVNMTPAGRLLMHR